MRTINNLLQSSLKVNITDAVGNAIENSKEVLIQQQQDQMSSGFGSDNKSINPLHGLYEGYAESTKRIKRSKGQISQWVTLKDKNDFYNGIFVDQRADEFVIDSADSKTQGLIDYYGDTIFGFNDESRKDLKEPLSNALITGVESTINMR